ncbi:glycosyltransferase family 1 protein [Micromonospora sp. WMMD1102]|uniref:glycosyltransferase family 4 protein n=1 Tax=Micromonospora sp. WMMD1102 TaxID=3016105 RepID=UPI00241569C0|nr:glycosyltransferase family 1 protein [Micromonospora sp. WMMD1102]MDG4786770.1 glycosyltransferase family 1 protein [Micromonospora sp. WMMD1102]
MTRVLVDIRANQPTGIARYGANLLRELAVLASVGDTPRLTAYVDPVQATVAREAIGTAPVRLLVAAEPDGFVRRSAELRTLLGSGEFDLYHTTHYTLDRRCPIPYSYTVHDLTRLRFPEHDYGREQFVRHFGSAQWTALGAELAALSDWDDGHGGTFRRYFRALNRALAAGASRIVAVSRATGDDLVRLLGVPAGAIDLVPCAVRTEIFHRRPPAEVTAARVRYALPGPYCLYVGLAGPIKRFDWLLARWLAAAERFPADARLVVVGGYAEARPEVVALLRDASAAGSVVFTGRVDDDTLAALYSGASALLVASRNEGNHLGPLEALACGCEVVCTDIPPLRETVDGHAHFYPLTDAARLTRLVDSALRGTLPRLGAGFAVPRWPDSGRALVDSLRRALTGHTDGPTGGHDTHAGRADRSGAGPARRTEVR